MSMDIDHESRINDITSRVEEALRREPPAGVEHEVIRYAPPAVRTLPLPEYVQHRPDVDQIGKAASEAIVQQYQGAMKALEAMGKELIDCVAKATAMSEQCTDAIKYVVETCDLYRDESKLIFARIEHASALTTEVRKVCDDLRRKIHHEKPEREHLGHSDPGTHEAAADLQAGFPNPLVRGQG